MMYGLERLEHLPLSLRLIREMHARLLQAGGAAPKVLANSVGRSVGGLPERMDMVLVEPRASCSRTR